VDEVNCRKRFVGAATLLVKHLGMEKGQACQECEDAIHTAVEAFADATWNHNRPATLNHKLDSVACVDCRADLLRDCGLKT